MKRITNIVCFFFTIMVLSQMKHPKASPAATVSQEVGLSTISVSYSRPAARGRAIFGGLVPFGRIWRVGANESTKITFDTSFRIGDTKLDSGTYALYAFPEKETWDIVFHTNMEHWGDGRKKYDENEDALRIKIKPTQESHFQENFLISFDQVTHNNVHMIWHWANTSITIPIHFDTDEVMELQIENKLQAETITGQTYYEIARYYVEQEINYKEALDYLNKAIALDGDTYYYHRVKSLVEAEMGDYKNAITSAEKSLALAKEQGKDEFVRMNQKNINLWIDALELKD